MKPSKLRLLYEQARTVARHFVCWLRTGHIWKELGRDGELDSTMHQCQSCYKCIFVDNRDGHLV